MIPTTSSNHYTENNGKKLKLCLGKTQKIEYEEDIIDFNTLLFITFHELAHTMTFEEGHTKEFYDNWTDRAIDDWYVDAVQKKYALENEVYTFCVKPMVCLQRPDYSDIAEGYLKIRGLNQSIIVRADSNSLLGLEDYQNAKRRLRS